LRKQISEQLKAINNGKTLQGKADELKAKVANFVKEKKDWTKEKKDIARSNVSLEKKLNEQTAAKHVHQQRMAEIALENKKVILKVATQRQINQDERHNAIQKGKKELASYTFRKRDAAKVADLNRKDEAKSKKAKVHADRLQVMSSDMLRTNRLNGGSFPSPGLSLQDACAQLSANEPNEFTPRAPPHAAMLPRAAAPLRQTTMTQVCDTPPDMQERGSQEHTPRRCYAAAMPPRPEMRQTTMTQVYEDTHQPAGAAVNTTGQDDENMDSDPLLPPGWQACRGDDDKVVCFHKATSSFETSLKDLFKKKEPQPNRRRSVPAAVTPAAKKKSPRPADSPPRPDAANSCSMVIIPTLPTARKITITRVPGVVDLMTSSGDENQKEEADDETDLEWPQTCDLPETCDFDPNRGHASDKSSDVISETASDTDSEKSRSLL
jgi:hypothetical protein